jgi:hypothetical protein
MRPTLLSSCARAATAAEARFRIGYQENADRASRVIALDDGAAALVSGLAGRHWRGGHFLAFDRPLPGNGSGNGSGLGSADALLHDVTGAAKLLSAELADADVAVMIAASDASAAPASLIGDACAIRGIMSAGLVLAETAGEDALGGVVAALRPNAMVLLVLRSTTDVPEILSALRV